MDLDFHSTSKVGERLPSHKKIMKDIWDKIFGIGFGKTGTTSLTNAVRILGIGPVAHGIKYIDELREVKFAADIFIAARWQFLAYAYPKAKFILTDRDTNSWLASTRRHYESTRRRSMEGTPTKWGLKIPLRTAESRWLVYKTTTFDPEKFRVAMNAHRLTTHIFFECQPERFLCMNIVQGDGWEKLCPFLDVPIPDAPFPHKNRGPA